MDKLNAKECVGVSELAKRLGVSKQTIYNKIRRGELAAKRFERGQYHGYLILNDDEGT